MNQNLQDDSLDNLLNQWADERSADSSAIENLQKRISLAIGDDKARQIRVEQSVSLHEPVEAPMPLAELQQARFGPQPVWPLRAKLVNRLVGATLLAAVAFIWTTNLLDGSRQWLQVAEVDQPRFPDYAQLTDDEISKRAIVLSEMKDVFGDQLNWLAETDSRFEVGLSEDSLASGLPLTQNEAAEIAVRVVVEERSSPDSTWQRTWAADVISQSEEVVELAAKNDDQTTMTMWAYVLPDGMVAIDSELSFPGDHSAMIGSQDAKFRAAFSNVQQDRRPSEEFLTGANGMEYRVFQTVAVLNKKVG
jgi:hypothetical protein